MISYKSVTNFHRYYFIYILNSENHILNENHIGISYVIVDRRPRNLAPVCSDLYKAEKELDYKTKLDISDLVKSSSNF